MCKDLRPNVVENAGFCYMLKTLEPRYDTAIPKLCREVKLKVGESEYSRKSCINL